MAKIYSAPKTIKPPKLEYTRDDFSTALREYEKQQQQYVENVRQFVKKRKPRGKLVGEVIRFGVADGYAEYMVAGLSPLELIHLELGDCYQFQYVERLHAQDVREMVEEEKAFARLFRRSRNAVPASC